jgi:hypothetical protein
MSNAHPAVLLAGLLLLTSVTVAPAQDRTREAREVGAFTEVSLGVPGTLHLRQGESRSVEVEATPKVLDHLETTVDGDELEIRDESNFLERMFDGDRDWGKIDVYVTAPTFEKIALAGSGAVVGETPIEGSSLDLENAGSGDVELEVTVTDLSASIAGSGTMRIRGTADRVEVRIAGSGTVQAMGLTTATAEIEVTGSGDTQLHVTNRLSARIIGSGDVEYRGSPEVDTSILGSGNVRSVE